MQAIMVLSAAGGLGLLFVLALTDARVMLLPNKYVAPFAVLGVVFHSASGWVLLSPASATMAAVAGGGLLLLLREAANRIYQRDALGLGDVKFIAASGLWLGLPGIFLALALGSVAGLLHGFIIRMQMLRRNKQAPHLSQINVPAGVGFAVGVLLAALYQFCPLLHTLF